MNEPQWDYVANTMDTHMHSFLYHYHYITQNITNLGLHMFYILLINQISFWMVQSGMMYKTIQSWLVGVCYVPETLM